MWKKAFIWRFAYSFRDLVHYNHDWEHGRRHSRHGCWRRAENYILIRLGLIQAFVTSTSILSNTRQSLLGDETFKYTSP